MPSARMTGLFGTQTTPPDIAVEPPTSSCFSSTSALAPAASAVSAATMPPPPDPTITKSTVESHSVMSRPPGHVDKCYDIKVNRYDHENRGTDIR